MARLAALTTLLVATLVSGDALDGEIYPRPWSSPYRRIRGAENTPNGSLREVLQRISSGGSDPNDDVIVLKLVKKAIVETATRTKNPATSLEIGAEIAQKLVADLTTAYTAAISNSRTIESAKQIFARFQETVQEIVDFTKNGRFVT